MVPALCHTRLFRLDRSNTIYIRTCSERNRIPRDPRERGFRLDRRYHRHCNNNACVNGCIRCLHPIVIFVRCARLVKRVAVDRRRGAGAIRKRFSVRPSKKQTTGGAKSRRSLRLSGLLYVKNAFFRKTQTHTRTGSRTRCTDTRRTRSCGGERAAPLSYTAYGCRSPGVG